MDRTFTVSGGPHQGWQVETDTHSFQFRTTHRTLTLRNPPNQAEVLNARFTMALTVPLGDPQWELFTAADNSRIRALRAAIPALVLPRIHAAVAATTTWTLTSSFTPGVIGRAELPDRSSVQLSAQVLPPQRRAGWRQADWDQHDAARALRHAWAGSRHQQHEAFSWVPAHLPLIPGMPAPDTDLTAQTDHVLRDIEAGRHGLIKVHFANAISTVGRETHTVPDLDQARALAREHQPFNNTRVSAWRITGWRNGADVTEPVDLTGQEPGTARPVAAAAFPATVTTTGRTTGPATPDTSAASRPARRGR